MRASLHRLVHGIGLASQSQLSKTQPSSLAEKLRAGGWSFFKSLLSSAHLSNRSYSHFKQGEKTHVYLQQLLREVGLDEPVVQGDVKQLVLGPLGQLQHLFELQWTRRTKEVEERGQDPLDT